MAKSKGKSKTAAARKKWRACKGVNKQTGRIKPGYKAAAAGGCPTKVTKAKKSSKKSTSRSRAFKAALTDMSLNGYGRRRARRTRRWRY